MYTYTKTHTERERERERDRERKVHTHAYVHVNTRLENDIATTGRRSSCTMEDAACSVDTGNGEAGKE
jgi:hypothetical protein